VATPLDRIVAIRDMVGTFTKAGFLAVMRPDKYLRIAAAVVREGMNTTSGIAMAAQRCPDRLAFVDELGSLTWRQLDERCNALAAGLQALPGQDAAPTAIGIMCRNHRGFLESLAAANKIGAERWI
jgi:non-ribosomal peptide synthetase component F